MRTVVFCVAMLGLTGGYIASQLAVINGQTKEYAASVDTPLFQGVSLVLLLICFVLPFIKGKGDEPS